jgi:hypothetical protein
LNQSNGGLPKLDFLKINYGFEGFGIRNSFTYRNFSQLKNYFELKFKKASMV